MCDFTQSSNLKKFLNRKFFNCEKYFSIPKNVRDLLTIFRVKPIDKACRCGTIADEQKGAKTP